MDMLLTIELSFFFFGKKVCAYDAADIANDVHVARQRAIRKHHCCRLACHQQPVELPCDTPRCGQPSVACAHTIGGVILGKVWMVRKWSR